MEEGWDYMYIYDKDDNLIQTMTGFCNYIWTDSVPGDTMKIRLVTDDSVNSYGFTIFKIGTFTGNETCSHPLCKCKKVIQGRDYVNSDDDPMDDNGHGTHVAGTAAGMDSVYRGIAPGANIIAMKVLDSSGSGTFSNVKSAIDRCAVWRNTYNISVITMSIGDNTQNNNPAADCDPFSTGLSIAYAYDNGQLVAVASVNNNFIN